METQKKELNAEDISVLVLLQTLDDFHVNDEYGDEVTSLYHKFDRYTDGMTPSQEEYDGMLESVENLIQAGLMKEDAPEEWSIEPLGAKAAKAIIDNELFDDDMVKSFQDSIAQKDTPEKNRGADNLFKNVGEWIKKHPNEVMAGVGLVLQGTQIIISLC